MKYGSYLQPLFFSDRPEIDLPMSCIKAISFSFTLLLLFHLYAVYSLSFAPATVISSLRPADGLNLQKPGKSSTEPEHALNGMRG